ncbi:peptidoglycan-binding domain-containing protein [Pararhodobacter marinus]|uniref:peptidoglycan-binding domain-containing protein n=1 Tax=Pararhodobacter marinus TaxID=2184063 RepID=UPI0035196040
MVSKLVSVLSLAILGLVVSSAVFSSPVHALSAHVRCLQDQLNAAGYRDGPVDGQVEDTTRGALENFARDHGLQIRSELTSDNAVTWCRRLGLNDPALRAYWPSARRPVALSIAHDIPRDLAERVENRLEAEIRSISALLGLDLSATDDVIVVRNETWRESLPRMQALRGAGDSPFFAQAMERHCTGTNRLGGWTVSGLTIFCLRNDAVLGETFSERDLRHALRHEAVHLIQHQVSALRVRRINETPGWDPHELPIWMAEGTAVILEGRYPAQSAVSTADRRLLSTFDNRDWPDLRQLETRLGLKIDYDGVYLGGAVAVSYLIARHGGYRALGNLYERMGEGRLFDSAFAEAFGLSLVGFYDEFAALGRTGTDGLLSR